MEIDVVRLAGLVVREVGSEEREGRLARVTIAARAYDTTVGDLWDAVTNISRIPRWFLPVSGALRLGGHYALEGNASGTITACDAPRSFAATWESMGGVSWIEVELTPRPEGDTLLRLKHAAHVDEFWDTYGPGATGVGWDLGMLGLELHLATNAPVNPTEVDAWSTSPEGKEFVRLSSEGWGSASIASGTDPAAAQAAMDRTTAFYTGDEHPEHGP